MERNFNKPLQIQDRPAYTASEAAHVLSLPVATLRAWCFGQTYTQRDGQAAKFHAVVLPADPNKKLLSFANLCELHVLSAIRRQHRVSLPTVRESLAYLRKEMKTKQPLIDHHFLTNGIDLFIQQANVLLNISQQGQQALRGDFGLALARIERDSQGAPVRLFPFSRPSQELADQPKAVVIDPRLAFGRPALARAGVTTDVIADRFRAGDSPQEMAEDFGVEQADILEALRFEQRLAA